MSDRGHDPALGRASLRVAEIPRPGVNLVGFFEAESGLGEFARRLARALEASGIPVSAIPYRRTLGRQSHAFDLPLGCDAPFDINLISLSADDLTRFASDVGPTFFAKRYSIGVWFWETTVFRSTDRHAARFLDELWVASDYVRDAVAREVDIPVSVMPVPIESPKGELLNRAQLDLPDAFTFLFVFDFWSGERKNPTAVIRAFTRAFEPDEGPVLILKSVHGRDWKPRQLEAVEEAAAERSDILIRDGYVAPHERDSLIAACDCYVSLHRSEGLGLTMAEAMACAKPVIATGHSGNLEFMSRENSHLVHYRLVDIPSTWWAYTPGAQWAEPDVEAAATIMRHVWEHPDEARVLGEAGRQDVLARFAPERTVVFLGERLAEARARGAIAARSSPHDARPAILEAARGLADELGVALAHNPGRRPTSFVRRLLRRVLWPHLDEQRRFDTAVVDALTTLHRSVVELERRFVKLDDPPARRRSERSD